MNIHSFSSFIVLHKNAAALSVFALLIAVFYGNTLANGFILDDRKVIEENVYVHSIRYLPKVVTGCIWEYTHGGCAGKTLHYRPIHSLSNLLVWQISSRPWFFHLIHLVYFFTAVSLVFLFAKLLTKNFLFALLSSILFLIHPINSEVVNWVSTVPDVTLVLFSLLALIFYVKHRNYKGVGIDKSVLFVYLFYFLAMVSKETAAFTVPPLIFALDVLIFRIPIIKLFRRQELKKYLLFAVPFLVYFLMRAAVLGGLGGLTSKGDYLGYFSFGERIGAFFSLFAYSVKEILYPYPLSFFHEVPIPSPVLNAGFLSSFLIVAVFVFLLYVFIKQKKGLAAFSLVWFFVFFAPMLIFFNIAGERNHFFERYLLGSSIGFSFLVGYFLAYLWQARQMFRQMPTSKRFLSNLHRIFSYVQPQKRRRALVLVVVGVTVALSWYIIFQRNTVWKDNITLLQATLELKPNATSIRDLLAYELLTIQGDVEAANREYEEILKRDPQYYAIDHVYDNLANYYRQKKEFQKAEEYYTKSIAAAGERNYKSYNNFGVFQIEQGQHLKALVNFCKARQIAPEAQEPKFNFSHVASQLESIDGEGLGPLYNDITAGGAFQKSAEERIRYESRECSGESCSFRFVTRLQQGELLFPFLILGKIGDEKVGKAADPSFNPQSGVITLRVSSEAQDKVISFIFPTCDRIYYEAVAKP